MYERTSLTVVEGTDDNVELILTREGSVDLPVLVNFTTISGTAEGGRLNLEKTALKLFIRSKIAHFYWGQLVFRSRLRDSEQYGGGVCCRGNRALFHHPHP